MKRKRGRLASLDCLGYNVGCCLVRGFSCFTKIPTTTMRVEMFFYFYFYFVFFLFFSLVFLNKGKGGSTQMHRNECTEMHKNARIRDDVFTKDVHEDLAERVEYLL